MPGPSEPISHSNIPPEGGAGPLRDRMGTLLSPLRGGGLKARTLRGASWTTMGFGMQQVLRLASNLILTRLLVPEAFGLMALAQVFGQGLKMLSDIGVGPSIVQNPRGEDPDFLATAWTMQVIRGFTLAGLMCLLAYPAAKFYEQPVLLPIFLLLAIGPLVNGFQNIGVSTASRKMMLGRLAVVDLSSHFVGIIVMIVWAYYSRDVWALVGGGLATAVIRVVVGYRVFPSEGSWFHFDRSAAGEIFHFGKWIFFATAMTYLGGQGLRLVQGALVPMDVLGMISIAGSLAIMARVLINRIGSSVLFPAFSEIQRENPVKLRKQLRVVRRKLFLCSFPVYATLILLGDVMIRIMYDERYEPAGLYLVIMATGGAIASLRTPFGMTLLAVGDSFGHSLNMSVMAVARIGLMVLGFQLYGVPGMLIGDVVADFVVYPFEAWRLQKHKLWFPLFDVVCFMIYLSLGAGSFYLVTR